MTDAAGATAVKTTTVTMLLSKAYVLDEVQSVIRQLNPADFTSKQAYRSYVKDLNTLKNTINGGQYSSAQTMIDPLMVSTSVKQDTSTAAMLNTQLPQIKADLSMLSTNG